MLRCVPQESEMMKTVGKLIDLVPGHVWQAGRYVLAGLLNTFIGYAVFWMLNQWLGMHIALANALCYAVALTVSYYLNRFFVFRGASGGRTVILFLASVAIAFGLNQAVLLALYYTTSLHEGLVQLFGMATYTIALYLLNKFWVFRVTPSEQGDQPAGAGARSGSSTK